MRVMFITQGALGREDRGLIAEVVTQYAQDPGVAELFFGFTEETTSGAAYALSCAVANRPAGGPSITIVVPHRVDSLRAEVRHAAETGDQFLELALGEGRYGENRYSNYVIELVRDIGQVVVFWDGSYTREPWDTVRWLRLVNLPGRHMKIERFGLMLDPVAFELYDLRGPAPAVREALVPEEKKQKRAK